MTFEQNLPVSSGLKHVANKEPSGDVSGKNILARTTGETFIWFIASKNRAVLNFNRDRIGFDFFFGDHVEINFCCHRPFSLGRI
tara:strand:+ start:1127 stop:1378 length:252 start_codon:yes stop_codon:yes gene_type:complete